MIVRGYFTSIESNKKDDVKPQNLNVNISIDGVKEGGKSLEFSYTYNVNYQPQAGSIKITGKVIYQGADHPKIVDSWSKDKKLPPEVGKEVVNSIMWNCSIQATTLAATMGLHPPLMLPRVSDKTKGTEIKSDDLRYFG